MEKNHIDLAYLLFKFNIFVFIPSEYFSSNEKKPLTQSSQYFVYKITTPQKNLK